MNINIKTIAHDKQRYPTCGDWRFNENGDLSISVSKLSDWRFEFLIAVHELVEAGLCDHAGIDQKAVDAFDIEFEKQRAKSVVLDLREPGDQSDAPYHLQHFTATTMERMLAQAIGVDWNTYEKELNSL